MPYLHRRLLAAGLLLAAGAAAPVRAAHPHYERLLRDGSFALERGEAADAARDLRLACFGFLEEPPALAACLTRLGLAQAASDDLEGFQDTFRRILEVEDRFGAFTAAELPSGLRAAFEAEVAARVPARILADSPAFSHLVPPPEEPVVQETLPPPESRPEPGLDADRTPEPAPEPVGPDLTAGERELLARARELLASARTRGELEEPLRLAREVADARSDSREAQHLAAVIAYRSARWEDAVRYFRRGGEPGDDVPEVLFYYAVSLYEAGEREGAARVLRRSLPRIEQTPFVRSYRAKILGEGPDPGGP